MELESGTLDLSRGELARRDGSSISLTGRELALLVYLLDHAGMIVSREELLREVWKHRPGVRSRAADSTMQRLRKKLEIDPSRPVHLISHHGQGFRLVLPKSLVPGIPPRAISQTIGRQVEVAWLKARIKEQNRLIIVTGGAGVGKTHLVLLCLRAWRRRVVTHRCSPNGAFEEQVRASLGTSPGALGPSVLWLSRCETRGAELEALLQDWLIRVPTLSIVVTSRREMTVPGAVLLRLEGLGNSEGAELLRRAASGALDPVSDEDLGEVSRQNHGNPMVLEQLGQQVQSLGVLALKDRHPKSSRIAQTLGRSIDRLTELQRDVLVSVATFPQWFSLSDAISVVEGGAIEPALHALERAGLLERRGSELRLARIAAIEGRRRLLQSPLDPGVALRHLDRVLADLHGSERLPVTGDLSLRDRHRSHAETLVELISRVEGVSPSKAIEARFSRHSWLLLQHTLGDVLDNAEAAERLGRSQPMELQLKTRLVLGHALVLLERFDAGSGVLERVIEDARREAFPEIAARAHLVFGSSMTDRRPEGAQEHIQRARALAESQRMAGLMREIEVRQAAAYLGAVKSDLALEILSGLLPDLALAGEPLLELRARNVQAIALTRLGQHEATIATCGRALDIAEDLHLPARAANTLGVMGGAQLQLGRAREAAETLTRSIELHRSIRQLHHAASATATLAMAYVELQDNRQAERLLIEALPLLHQAGWGPNVGAAQATLGLALLASSRPREALETLRSAVKNFGDADPQGSWTIGVLMDLALGICGDPSDREPAIPALRHARDTAPHGVDSCIVDAALGIVLLHNGGDMGEIDALYHAAVPTRTVDGRIALSLLRRTLKQARTQTVVPT